MKNKKGFTLIELIVVVAIIGILVAVLVPSISGQFDNAKETAAKANAKVFYSASQTSVTTILAGWEVKGPVTQGDFAIPSIYYESGEYRVYFGKNTADSSGEVEPISNAVRTGYVSANETDTTTSATDLQTVKEINKHMKLYLGDNSKLTTDKGGYQLSGGTTPTPPPQPPQPPVEGEDTANPADVTMKIKTTGNNATGTFAGREYILEVTGLTKDAKYKVTIAGETKGEFTATGAVQTIDLKGLFAPVVMAQTTTHKAEVSVVALNPATGVTAEKGSIVQDLSFYDGDGSTATPYLICDSESLEMLSFKVKNDNANFANKNYKQIVSVDMSTVANFVPIGGLDIVFKGTYDGGAKADGSGYEIKNLTIDGNGSDGIEVGLFGSVDNATLKNIRIGSGSVIKGKGGVGGIVGYAKTTTIQNSYNSAAVTGTGHYVGGIAGYIDNKSIIKESSNTGDVKGTDKVGGISGYTSETDIINCHNSAAVSGSAVVGGIVGEGSSITIENCKNSAAVTGTGNDVGGIAGSASSLTITQSSNTGDVKGASNVGGIAGFLQNGSTITQSSNTGDVKGASIVGGIVGHARSSNIQNCYNTATVTGTGSTVGGIAGGAVSITLTQCHNTGSINSADEAGGIVSSLIDQSVISNSYNTGAVSGGASGGIVAHLNNSTVRQSYNTATVSASSGDAGGIVANSTSNGKNIIENTYNTGAISGKSKAGGIVGSGSTTVTNCFNTGNVTGTTVIGGAVGSQGARLTNVLFKDTITIQGANIIMDTRRYTNISEFVNATGANRSKWDDNGKLKNEDGTLMAGPNPGGA